MSRSSKEDTRTIACMECDLMIYFDSDNIKHGDVALCPRCGHKLMNGHEKRLDSVIAFSISAVILLVMANVLPFLAFEAKGQSRAINLLTTVSELFGLGFPVLGTLVFGFVILLPLIYLLSVLLIAISTKYQLALSPPIWIAKLVSILLPWAMTEVFIIGVMVALIKVVSMASIVFGLAFWAYILFSILFIYISVLVDPLHLWEWVDPKPIIVDSAQNQTEGTTYSALSAAKYFRANCHICHTLAQPHCNECRRCGTSLHIRTPHSVQSCLALVATSLLLYIPANVFPIMTTTIFGTNSSSTIIGGITVFIEHGSYFIAAVIFTASILIPMAKILAILWLCRCAVQSIPIQQLELTKLYRITEFIGKWSMVDVFVVAILVALVQVGGLMAIKPGIAATSFAGVVVATMIAAHKFDVRLLWDKSIEI